VPLAGKVVVVTGGGRGIGRAIVEGFLREGSNVVVLERNWDDIGVWKNELDRRPDALPLTVDVTNDKHLATAYQATIERFGTVDVICNNAGFRQRDVSPTAVIKVLEIPRAGPQRDGTMERHPNLHTADVGEKGWEHREHRLRGGRPWPAG
jgi:NAD(P)-dependent dehydrogenase (short-subunit alcohol dehydrogenase family)